jgi:hypothetical protein
VDVGKAPDAGDATAPAPLRYVRDRFQASRPSGRAPFAGRLPALPVEGDKSRRPCPHLSLYFLGRAPFRIAR